MAETTVLHGRDMQGTTAQRPGNPYAGCRFFDTTIGYLLCWTGTEWRPCSTPRGTTAARPAATAVPAGSLYWNTSLSALQYSDGATWLTTTVT